MIVFHNQVQQLSGTMAQQPVHVVEPAKHSPANRPRGRIEFHPRKLLSLLFTPYIISERIEYIFFTTLSNVSFDVVTFSYTPLYQGNKETHDESIAACALLGPSNPDLGMLHSPRP